MTNLDALFTTADSALRTLFAHHHSRRVNPTNGITKTSLSDDEKREASALMRVNHVGDDCVHFGGGHFVDEGRLGNTFD